MSPRRSSRARSSQQPTTSSSSNSTSTLKVTRTNTQRSESIESPVPATADDNTPQETVAAPVMPRRSRRGGGDDTNHNILVNTASIADKMEVDEEEIEENIEEEITRCVCGQLEYPGPSQTLKELAAQQNIIDPLSEDLGNFFVQCDNDSVWQHAGCVGLTDEGNLPEEYYCEVCKPDFHKITRGLNGVKSSRYLPIVDTKSTRSSSLSSSSGERTRRKSSASKHSDNTKRRATMNSRGAYDEDEMLRRAIEESKEMGSLGKRSRDETDDIRPSVKRQRTASSTASSRSKRSQSPATVTEDAQRSTTSKTHKLRGVVTKNKEKEFRDKQKEQAAAQRAEAASKRNARSERRRGDDSPPPTPDISPAKMATSTITGTKVKAETPSANRGLSKGKTGRPARRGRLGRNQYTRDMPVNGDNSDTPARDTSHDRNGGSPNGNNINGESGRSSKAKTHPARTSMNEMKRRVAAILEFVGRMQTEGAAAASQQSSGRVSSKGANTPSENGNGKIHLPTASLVKAVHDATAEAAEAGEAPDGGMVRMKDDKDYQSMGSAEMMETLAKELVSWQNVYGIYSR